MVALGAALVSCALLSREWRSPQERLAECESNLKNLGTALEMYSTDWGGKYPTSLTQLTPNYLKTIPNCPNARTGYAGGVEIGPHSPHNMMNYDYYYYVCCKGRNHEDAGLAADQPYFDGIFSLVEPPPHVCTPECSANGLLRVKEATEFP